MSLDDVDNHDANCLPFADCELAIDVHPNITVFQKAKYNKRKTTKKKSEKQQSNEKTNNSHVVLSYVYFENTEDENNFLTLIPYTGPSNTIHLNRHLYLPQLTTISAKDSTISFQRFIQDYDRVTTSLVPSLETMTLSVYLRFGISYIIRADTMHNQPLPLGEYAALRNGGKHIKTAFYTCKGVTSPKLLLTTLIKTNYRQISSNTYTYDVQLYGMKSNLYSILHFQYDEQFQCCAVYYRPEYPINFDFIRNKTSSRFRSIDDSYSDIFDFRIQLTQCQSLSKTDPNVLAMLRGVPINQVLFLDTSTQVLHVSPKLQKFVKYLKCTRSSNYQNFDEQILISIGTYEEFQLNKDGQCEPLMKSSNTMTIELIDLKTIPSGKKLYDIGMWFSTLCQSCVDLPTAVIETNKSYRWFSDISIFGRKYNQSIKQMNVNQLTTYKTQKSNKTYTSDELAFVRRILEEENLRNVLLNTNQDKKDIEQIYDKIKQRLITIAAPSANEALKKVERAYRAICNEFVE